MDGGVLGACVSDPWKSGPLFASVERALLVDLHPVFRVYHPLPPGPRVERNHVYYNSEAPG